MFFEQMSKSNANKWQMGFNLVFNGLMLCLYLSSQGNLMFRLCTPYQVNAGGRPVVLLGCEIGS